MSTAQYFMLLVIIITLSGVAGYNGYYTSSVDQCRFTPDLSDLEFIRSSWFNKAKYLQFNSTVGKFVGYTEFGVYNAERWNKDPAILAQMRAEKDRYCRPNAQIEINNILTKTVEPIVRLSLERTSRSGHPAMLRCSAYNFYPKLIKLSWYKNGQEVTGDVISTEELSDGDWYYQIHSHLEFTPKHGEKISCVVEHASLKEPLEMIWDPSMSKAEWYMIAMGVAEIALGLGFAVAGFIYYKKKSREWILAPKTCPDKSLDVYTGPHPKNKSNNVIPWLLSSYKYFIAHHTKSAVKSIMNTD